MLSTVPVDLGPGFMVTKVLLSRSKRGSIDALQLQEENYNSYRQAGEKQGPTSRQHGEQVARQYIHI